MADHDDTADRPPVKTFNLRLPAALFAELDAYAKATERSVNGAAVYAIRQFLDRDKVFRSDNDVHLR